MRDGVSSPYMGLFELIPDDPLYPYSVIRSSPATGGLRTGPTRAWGGGLALGWFDGRGQVDAIRRPTGIFGEGHRCNQWCRKCFLLPQWAFVIHEQLN